MKQDSGGGCFYLPSQQRPYIYSHCSFRFSQKGSLRHLYCPLVQFQTLSFLGRGRSPDRFAAVGTSDYSTRSSRTGSTVNSKALIASTAARIVGSETGSTVMTNDTRSLGISGSCSKESILIS